MNHRLARITLLSVTLALLIAVVFGLWLSHSRAVALIHPDRVPVDQWPDEFGIVTWEEVTFPAEDSLSLAAWFIPPDPASNGASLILVHGFRGNRGTMLPLAAPLVAQGYGALLLDLRNNGDSAGTLTTLGYYEIADVSGAVAYLQARPEVGESAPLVLIGHSMGAATVLRAAARLPEVDAVVSISGFTSLEDNVADGVRQLTGLPPFPFAPLVIFFGEQEAGVGLSEVRPIDDLPAIAPRPVLFIHGEDDPLIPVYNAERLYAAASEPKMLVIVPGGGHGDLVEHPDPATLDRLLDFLDSALPK